MVCFISSWSSLVLRVDDLDFFPGWVSLLFSRSAGSWSAVLITFTSPDWALSGGAIVGLVIIGLAAAGLAVRCFFFFFDCAAASPRQMLSITTSASKVLGSQRETRPEMFTAVGIATLLFTNQLKDTLPSKMP